MVHFLNKGGGGGGYLGEDLHGEKRGQSGRMGGSPAAARLGREMRRERDNEGRKKKGLATEPVLRVGHQHCWRPTVSLGHQRGWCRSGPTWHNPVPAGYCPRRPIVKLGHHDRWRPVLRSIYKNSLSRDPFIKRCYGQGPN
jgi:hypothetical protein